MADTMFDSLCYTCRHASVFTLVDTIPGDGVWVTPKTYVTCGKYGGLNPGYALIVHCPYWTLKALEVEPEVNLKRPIEISPTPEPQTPEAPPPETSPSVTPPTRARKRKPRTPPPQSTQGDA